MPPHPSRRLNLLLVPAHWDQASDPDALQTLWKELIQQGYVLADGRPGPNAQELIAGGFALFRVDQPPRYGVYGNRVGGFQVRCPSCGADLPKVWGQAVETLRSTGHWSLSCPSCGTELGPGDAHTRPLAAIGRFALEFRDVGAADLKSIPAFAKALGEGWQLVYLRG